MNKGMVKRTPGTHFTNDMLIQTLHSIQMRWKIAIHVLWLVTTFCTCQDNIAVMSYVQSFRDHCIRISILSKMTFPSNFNWLKIISETDPRSIHVIERITIITWRCGGETNGKPEMVTRSRDRPIVSLKITWPNFRKILAHLPYSAIFYGLGTIFRDVSRRFLNYPCYVLTWYMHLNFHNNVPLKIATLRVWWTHHLSQFQVYLVKHKLSCMAYHVLVHL